MKLLCKLGVHIGCIRGYSVPLVIEFGFNAISQEEAKQRLEEILPGIKSYFYNHPEYGPVMFSVGKPKI